MNANKEIEKLVVELNTSNINLAQKNKNLEIEIERLKNMRDYYKKKYEMLLDAMPGEPVIELSEDMIIDRELRLVK